MDGVVQVTAPLCRHLVESINKKNKTAKVKDFMVKNHMWVFVNCQIENPAFDSQVRLLLSLTSQIRASDFIVAALL